MSARYGQKKEKRKKKMKRRRRERGKRAHTSRFVDRGAHFSKFEGRNRRSRRRSIRKSWPHAQPRETRHALFRRLCAHVSSLAVFTYVVHTARVCALTSLCSSWRGRYGARVPPRAPRTDTRHRAAAPLLATVQPYTPYTRAFT